MRRTRRSPRRHTFMFASALAAMILAASAELARADEGGASIYLLGSGGPGAAIMPPVKGVFFDNTLIYVSGEAGGGKQFPLGGNVVADLDTTLIADFVSVLWVPKTDFAGGVLGIGGALPVGDVSVDVSGVITGPRGGSIGVSRHDGAAMIADPIVTAQLGWAHGNYHWQVSSFVNIPIGHYREDELANLAFHRWAGDLSLAGTWHDDKSGWDVSGKAGFTFNGTNEHTDYTSGTDFHLEAAVEKTFTPAWSAGLQAYYFDQVSGDSGSGATLGDFEGEVTGAGPTIAYHFDLDHKPVTVRARAMWEFDATNRPENDSVWLEFTVPLHMQLPASAG